MEVVVRCKNDVLVDALNVNFTMLHFMWFVSHFTVGVTRLFVVVIVSRFTVGY